MFNSISWGGYWSVLSILVVIYYLYVLLAYYRTDIRNLQTKKITRHGHHENDNEGILYIVQAISDEMKAYIEQAAHAGALKSEIIFAMQQIIKKYPGLKFTPHENNINNLIQSECKDKCAFFLSAEEIKQVWIG